MNKNSSESWDDGTPRSTGNAFTAHGYVPGLPARPSPVRQKYGKGGFGSKGGTIAGMGAAKFNVAIKQPA
jgi:hypothetical protein